MATAIGSLPHRDAGAAAALVLRCLPELPAAPQLPMRTPREGVVAQWARCDRRCRRRATTARSTLHRRARPARADRHDVRRAGARRSARRSSTSPPRSRGRRSGSRCSARARSRSVSRSSRPACDVDVAFALGARVARAWAARARGARRRRAFPNAALVLLLRRARARALARRGTARSTARSRPTCSRPRSRLPRCLTAVHVCGRGDLRLALDAGPRLVHFDVGALDLDDAVALSRFLDGGGWVIVGRDPDRPAGRRAGRADLEGAARRVVRADAARLRSVAAAGAGARRARVRSRRSRREPGRARDAARARDRRPRARPRRGHEARRSARRLQA